MDCPECGTPNKDGAKFCAECGAALALRCPSCGERYEPGQKFCSECGTALGLGTAPSAPGPATPVSERRLVSVLFLDLVSFTSLSEHRDPEEIRELLSQYFDRSRTLIERYGGTVEKFIGDAVMAVWGTPVAREDDPERAVRAALALVRAVSALGAETGMPALRARAGVLTGNAAVELGAEDQGMVLGDTVNTASRLQSIAEPGTVLVDDVTRRASEAAIAYEDAGSHQVKGREQPVRAWTALRVLAGAGGARRSAGLETPLVGRDRELQAIIDAGEDSAHSGRVRHVTIVGEAGAGKSRLLWEYFKYIDGIEETRWWHQGRCLSYGEGVGYWALAEMVRTRAQIQEDEDPASARDKLRATVHEHVSDERERRMVEPRLAHLLRLEERPGADRADLFSGWRLFFERMAASQPLTLAFEDLQWADSGLLDFIDYLLEWSAELPIYVLTLGRPELRARRPGWEAMTLAPLAPGEVAQMLDALVPGLPSDLVEEIGRRSEGIPLYAVETVRMLQDRGLLVADGARYVVAGDVSDLAVPETLHALVASRLDGLSVAERSLLQDASVLGQSFTAASAAALSGRPETDVEGVLDSLVVKQILSRDDDPRSPDRGQYVFLQALLRTVAYGTLSRRTRKARHLAAARHLEETWPGEQRDIAEVLASHYLEAIAAEPDAEDAGALRASARERLTAAGQAAASLALGSEAAGYFAQAHELADDDLERATLLEQAGVAMFRSGRSDAAEERLRQAIVLHRQAGSGSGGRATVELAHVLRTVGRNGDARALLEMFLDADEATDDPIVRAEALIGLGTSYTFAGELDVAAPLMQEALDVLEAQQAWPALADALVAWGVHLAFRYRVREAEGTQRLALQLAEENDLPAVALRASYNLAGMAVAGGRYTEALGLVDQAVELAHERGDRVWERQLHQQGFTPSVILGRWEEAMTRAPALMGGEPDFVAIFTAAFVALIAAARDDPETLERCRALADHGWDETDADIRGSVSLIRGRIAIAAGEPAAALAPIRSVLQTPALAVESFEEAYAMCLELALELDDPEVLGELQTIAAQLPPVRRTPLIEVGAARVHAELAHRRGDHEASELAELGAIELLRGLGARPLLGRALAERARRRQDPESLVEARAIFAELGAVRWLEQAQDVPFAVPMKAE